MSLTKTKNKRQQKGNGEQVHLKKNDDDNELHCVAIFAYSVAKWCMLSYCM
jgi:hypothetical protein